jgi:hypothetical protein
VRIGPDDIPVLRLLTVLETTESVPEVTVDLVAGRLPLGIAALSKNATATSATKIAVIRNDLPRPVAFAAIGPRSPAEFI